MVVGDDGIIPQTLVHEVDVRRRGRCAAVAAALL